jgi:hypothetical protein
MATNIVNHARHRAPRRPRLRRPHLAPSEPRHPHRAVRGLPTAPCPPCRAGRAVLSMSAPCAHAIRPRRPCSRCPRFALRAQVVPARAVHARAICALPAQRRAVRARAVFRAVAKAAHLRSQGPLSVTRGATPAVALTEPDVPRQSPTRGPAEAGIHPPHNPAPCPPSPSLTCAVLGVLSVRTIPACAVRACAIRPRCPSRAVRGWPHPRRAVPSSPCRVIRALRRPCSRRPRRAVRAAPSAASVLVLATPTPSRPPSMPRHPGRAIQATPSTPHHPRRGVRACAVRVVLFAPRRACLPHRAALAVLASCVLASCVPALSAPRLCVPAQSAPCHPRSRHPRRTFHTKVRAARRAAKARRR